MPAYYTVGLQYDRAAVRPDFLRNLYATMMHGDFNYGGVLPWGCRGNLTLHEVIRWNQERLDRDFELGFTEDVSNDYRQVLLHHPQYSECRLIHIIVPEADVFDIGGPLPAELYPADAEELTGHTRPEQVEPLKQLALAVWQSGLVNSVQTYGELGAATGYASLREGEAPSMLPFAIVEAGWIGRPLLAERSVRVLPIGETGILLERIS
jgi:hypothetical protein